ncbi:MAG: hypothetical protein E6G31_10605, partial [Actinobacteria bacterium]
MRAFGSTSADRRTTSGRSASGLRTARPTVTRAMQRTETANRAARQQAATSMESGRSGVSGERASSARPGRPVFPRPAARGTRLYRGRVSAEPQLLPESFHVSFSPDGTVFRIPSEAESRSTFREIAESAEAHRLRGGQIVVVQGLGFVGSAVAAAVASVSDEAGRPLHYVIGVDLATPASYWKVGKINEGEPPFHSPDENLPPLFRQAVHERANLRATTCETAYSLADVIIVDVHLDVEDRAVHDAAEIQVNLAAFEQALHTIGRHMRADALVLVETTVPMGTCERIALPILREE